MLLQRLRSLEPRLQDGIQSILRHALQAYDYVLGRYSRRAQIIVLLIFASLIIVHFISEQQRLQISGGMSVFAQRDFRYQPFDMIDAYNVCELEAKAKLGDSLLRSHMLPLSTHYDEISGTYLMVLNADVGSISLWSEATIYCSIDPAAEEISYYKEVYQQRPSLMSRTVNFLEDLF